ncbi:DinB family protein [Mesobacillus zeae]|uniref:DinB family protein n=1 Tax=Mesobacillus zeae TaxID=1917180 RepID=A0A398B7P7_9BACI|nr:DinB family protein [Mesobacillus zeae]RID85551.1 DinB family protein [Mesobacillus zeae]
MNGTQAEKLMTEWLEHRKVLEALLNTIVDDEHIDFKPWDGAMSLGELALHMAGWNDVFVSMVKTEVFSPPDIPKCETMEDLRKSVKNFTEKTKAAFEIIADTELEAENTASHPKLKGTKNNYLAAMYDHEIHNKG